MFKVPEEHRVTKKSPLATDSSAGNNGSFYIPHHRIKNYFYLVHAECGDGFEHIFIGVCKKSKKPHRAPVMEETFWVKNLFWGEMEGVLQFMPGKVGSLDTLVLHLWRWAEQDVVPISPEETT